MTTKDQENTQREPEATWPVMILAHNEEENILACLESLQSAEPGRRFAIFVMANGCTDDTEGVVRQYAKTHEGVEVVSIALGDKNNAWNVFIHQVVPEKIPHSDMYFFMDGDARAGPKALSELATGLRNNPRAHAAGALPGSGRSMRKDSEFMIRYGSLVANLYALRGSFVKQLQEKKVKLPLKLEGDDGLIGALVKWDLDPSHQQYDHSRIVTCPTAFFTFRSFSWRNFAHWKTYWRRCVRYGRRRYEFELLGPKLKAEGIEGLPEDITELYHLSANLTVRWRGIYTITDWVALKEMRRFCR
jgi:glycosyltransferase involved in cell wall biosynthesis